MAASGSGVTRKWSRSMASREARPHWPPVRRRCSSAMPSRSGDRTVAKHVPGPVLQATSRPRPRCRHCRRRTGALRHARSDRCRTFVRRRPAPCLGRPNRRSRARHGDLRACHRRSEALAGRHRPELRRRPRIRNLDRDLVLVDPALPAGRGSLARQTVRAGNASSPVAVDGTSDLPLSARLQGHRETPTAVGGGLRRRGGAERRADRGPRPRGPAPGLRLAGGADVPPRPGRAEGLGPECRLPGDAVMRGTIPKGGPIFRQSGGSSSCRVDV